MNILINLLEDFLANRITPSEFEGKFLDLCRELRDEQHRAADQKPELKKALEQLFDAHQRGEIGRDDFTAKYRPLAEALYKNCRIKAFSKEEEILSRLFNAVDDYAPPDLRGPDNIGEAELFEAARQALFSIRNIGETR